MNTILLGNKSRTADDKSIVTHDEHKSVILTKFKVYQSYKIETFVEPNNYDELTDNGVSHAQEMLRYKKIVGSGEIAQTYNPDETNIYRELLKIKTMNIEHLRLFCTKFGIPVINHKEKQSLRVNFLSFDHMKDISINQIKVDELSSAINEFQKAANIWHDIQHNSRKIDNIARELDKFDITNNWHEGTELDNISQNKLLEEYKTSTQYQAFASTKDYSTLAKAKQYLAYEITKNLRPSSHIQGLTFYKGSFRPQLAFSSPIDYAWYQLKEHVSGGTNYVKCWHCKTLFIPSKTNQHFCPTVNIRSRSNCENALSQKFRYHKENIMKMINENRDWAYISTHAGNIHPEYIKERIRKIKKRGV
ncbi:MAG: hypothetical protein H6Q66_2838 [Firmicutes bacterium]|nr:hypothetical protein [Bacillota bacterium]